MPAVAARWRMTGTLVFLALISAVPDDLYGQPADVIRLDVAAEQRELLESAERRIAAGDAKAAYELLQSRETELAGNAYFDYLLGISALDAGRHGEAIFALRRSVAVEPGFAGARLELARAYYESSSPGLARPLFAALLDENPPPGVRIVIQQYIDAIDQRPPTPRSRLQAYLESFVGHDSNANGSTANQQFMGFTLSPENLETESPFAEVGAGFSLTAPTSPRFAWLASGRVAHRTNTDASFVDATILSGFGGVTWQRGPYFGRAGVEGYWSARDGDANESFGGVDLLAGRNIGEWDASLGIRAGAQRFDDALAVLDVDRILYTLDIGRRFSPTTRLSLQAIGGEDSEAQSGSPYGNSKAGARLALRARTGDSTYLFAAVGSLVSDYDGLFFGATREDTQTTAMLRFDFRDVLTDGLSFSPTFRYIDNESDVALYDYDRLEIGLLIRWMPR